MLRSIAAYTNLLNLRIMENPLKKDNKKGLLIIGVALGALVAGVAKYFYSRNKSEVDSVAGELKDNTIDYLQKKRNRIKSNFKGL